LTSASNWSQQKLGYKFSNPELLTQALTHKSRSAQNNERMEFLGDAVLGLIIAEVLFHQEIAADEGTLSRLRALLVRRETLADIAAELGLGDMLRLGSGESRSGGHHRKSIMADALEAVIGAVLLDSEYKVVRELILRLYHSRLADLPDIQALKDPKTLLQEALQADGFAVPEYQLIGEEGPPHARRFEVRCTIPEWNITTTGSATSRRAAEQRAAAAALEQIATR